MWKVLVILCMVGYDCTAFKQSPMQFYETYDECLIVAHKKRDLLIMSYAEHGYFITESKSTCELQPVT